MKMNKNNGLQWKNNTKFLILKQKGTRMTEDGEDWNGLEMTILKSLAIFFFKIHERWCSSLKKLELLTSIASRNS